MSQTLYKYFPVNEGALKVLSDATLKFTNPSNFNDPFDCYPNLKTIPLTELKRKEPNQYRALSEHLELKGSGTFNKRRCEDKKLADWVSSGRALQQILDDVGICCFSESSSNILMWGHYADQHKGFVCEFEGITQQFSSVMTNKDVAIEAAYNLFSFPITYAKERPIITFPNEPNQATLERMILFKFEDWEYEREHRVFDWERRAGIHSYNPQRLRAIIFGANIDDKHKKTLTDLVNVFNLEHNTNVQLKQARLADSTYEILVDLV